MKDDLYGRTWSDKEYIVVLDAYFSHAGEPRHENAAFIKELANLLGRTPASITMRFENFTSVDPEIKNHRRGLTKVSATCVHLFNKFQNKREVLSEVAAVFGQEIRDSRTDDLDLFTPARDRKAFGKYELLDEIGQGGFGTVYSCIDAQTGESAALKVIHADRVRETEAIHRFAREIRALKSVKHENVIRLREDNLADEKARPAFVMDLAETNLDDHLMALYDEQRTRPALPAIDAIAIMRAMMNAVVALHEHEPPIIHRDVNPTNILRMPGGRWVLADFGLAKFVGGESAMPAFATKTKAALGTTFYAAPEQYHDLKRTDARTDVYALGVLLWQLFSTHGPPPDTTDPGLTSPLAMIYTRATNRAPEKRFQTVREFSQAFEGHLS